MGDTSSSFTLTNFGAVGSPNTSTGISWATPNTTTIARTTIDISKTVNPLDLWTQEVAYTIPELRSAELLGRPIDAQQLTALNLKHQMDSDQLVYIGDPNKGTTGLVNNANVTSVLVAPGASGSTLWSQKVPEEILADFNSMLTSAWKASGYAVVPNQVRIAPVPFGYISTEVVSTAGNRTIMNFITEENILKAEKGINLDIKSLKWLDKTLINGPSGSAATYDTMMAYTREQRFVRWPMVPLAQLFSASSKGSGLKSRTMDVWELWSGSARRRARFAQGLTSNINYLRQIRQLAENRFHGARIPVAKYAILGVMAEPRKEVLSGLAFTRW